MARLSTFELLALSEEEQLIVRCLALRPGSTLAEIAQLVQLSVQELEVHIKRLVQESRLVEQLRDGQRIFSVRFKRERQRIMHATRLFIWQSGSKHAVSSTWHRSLRHSSNALSAAPEALSCGRVLSSSLRSVSAQTSARHEERMNGPETFPRAR